MIEYLTVISPCKSICQLDKNSVCVGCFRTLEEIRNWYDLDDEGKRKILKAVTERVLKK